MSGEEQIILPEGFKKVEYLESTGTQFIDTQIICDSESTFGCSFYQKDASNLPLFGCEPNNGKDFCAWLSSGTSVWLRIADESYFVTTETNMNRVIHWEFSKKGIFRNGNLIKSYNSVPNCVSSTYIFNRNPKWGVSTAIGRLYKAYIKKGNEYVFNGIPCIEDSTNAPCLFDLVSQKPFYNQGTGKFLTPKDYEWNYPLINNDYNLPAGFKKCTYLQSDGTQWIDTGVLPNNETGLLLKALRLNNADAVPFGAREGESIYVPRYSTKNKAMNYGWVDGVTPFYYDKADDLQYTSCLNFYNDRLAKMLSLDTDWVGSLNKNLKTFTTQSLWLFSHNWEGSYNTTYSNWGGRIYRAQITQGNVLIHDYVPCLDANGRPCMYDLIESEALYNQSGGTEFAYCVEHQLPSDFIKLKYLESTGTQYIKTGYVPTNNTGLYVDTQDTGGGDTIPMGSWNSTSTNTRFFITRQTASKTAGYGWGNWNQISSTTGSVRYDSTLNWLNNRKSITNNPLFSAIITNLAELSFTPQYDIWMFGVNHAKNHAYKFKGRIYRARISEGSEIVRDFVPAYDELKLKPCMYDRINNIAYYNDGEGEFLTNRDFEGTYKGFTGLGCIGNRLSGNCYHLVNALITDGNCRINLGKGIIDSNISHDFRGYTTDSNKFMFGTSNVGLDYFWQGDGCLVWGGLVCNVVSNSDVIVVVDAKNNKVRYNNTIITKNANFTSDKKTSIFDVGRADSEKKYKPAANGSKFYKWVMKKDGVIIHDYRPAVDNNSIPCVLDTISGEAFYNTLGGTLSWE